MTPSFDRHPNVRTSVVAGSVAQCADCTALRAAESHFRQHEQVPVLGVWPSLRRPGARGVRPSNRGRSLEGRRLSSLVAPAPRRSRAGPRIRGRRAGRAARSPCPRRSTLAVVLPDVGCKRNRGSHPDPRPEGRRTPPHSHGPPEDNRAFTHSSTLLRRDPGGCQSLGCLLGRAADALSSWSRRGGYVRAEGKQSSRTGERSSRTLEQPGPRRRLEPSLPTPSHQRSSLVPMSGWMANSSVSHPSRQDSSTGRISTTGCARVRIWAASTSAS